jgi:hypothetical protein
MIQRLVASLEGLARLAPDGLLTAHGRALARDCADALRLELDCPQEALRGDQRASLRRLSDLLEDDGAAGAQIVEAVRQARAVL